MAGILARSVRVSLAAIGPKSGGLTPCPAVAVWSRCGLRPRNAPQTRIPPRGIASRKLAGGGVTFLFVLFRQFVDDDLGCASYLSGGPAGGEAFVVDPAYSIEQYLEAAADEAVRIVRVLETHTHADHVSGHGRFALEHGVPVSIHPFAEPEYPFDPLEDGRELQT